MSTRLRWSIAIAFVVLLVGGYAAWVGASAWQASKVSITAAELVECKDPRSIVPLPEGIEDPLDHTGPLRAISVDRRLDCVLRTMVVSDASVPVEVEFLEWPYMGPATGMGVRAGWAVGGEPGLVKDADSFSARDSIDAVFDMDGFRELYDDERTPFTIRAVFNASCNDAGMSSVPDSPRATIRVLGRSHVIAATGAGIGLVHSGPIDCDEDLGDS
ncbi:hypothetical protein [Aeromicrobium sp. HA]|uniref:hypothetical protein n=1 Tax=Aeromicrobium sp. HA TaxID=3009077 RepID=UPI0022AEA602|nr:hypothetical protein [Aeromicrobium sp. HA]